MRKMPSLAFIRSFFKKSGYFQVERIRLIEIVFWCYFLIFACSGEKTWFWQLAVITLFRFVFIHLKSITSYSFSPIDLKFLQNAPYNIVTNANYQTFDILYCFWITCFQTEKFHQNCHIRQFLKRPNFSRHLQENKKDIKKNPILSLVDQYVDSVS